jgi:hypothetical protein
LFGFDPVVFCVILAVSSREVSPTSIFATALLYLPLLPRLGASLLESEDIDEDRQILDRRTNDSTQPTRRTKSRHPEINAAGPFSHEN